MKIPFTNEENKYLDVLFTCHHVISKEYLESEKDINILFDNEVKIISLKKTRRKWYDKNLDYTCIEIKEKDNIDNNFYIYNNNNNSFLNNGTINIIIFSYVESEKNGFSDGFIGSFKDFHFDHNCNTIPGCSGGVIVDKSDNSVIGMHTGGIKNRYCKRGVFLKDIIENIKSKPLPQKMKII